MKDGTGWKVGPQVTTIISPMQFIIHEVDPGFLNGKMLNLQKNGYWKEMNIFQINLTQVPRIFFKNLESLKNFFLSISLTEGYHGVLSVF